jgi:hypothetical protein
VATTTSDVERLAAALDACRSSPARRAAPRVARQRAHTPRGPAAGPRRRWRRPRTAPARRLPPAARSLPRGAGSVEGAWAAAVTVTTAKHIQLEVGRLSVTDIHRVPVSESAYPSLSIRVCPSESIHVGDGGHKQFERLSVSQSFRVSIRVSIRVYPHSTTGRGLEMTDTLACAW